MSHFNSKNRKQRETKTTVSTPLNKLIGMLHFICQSVHKQKYENHSLCDDMQDVRICLHFSEGSGGGVSQYLLIHLPDSTVTPFNPLMKMLGFHFWGGFMSSILIYTQWLDLLLDEHVLIRYI